MRRSLCTLAVIVATATATACGDAATTPIAPDAATIDASVDAPGDDASSAEVDDASGGADRSDVEAAPACSVDGVDGVCISVTACAALTGYASTPGKCAGPADIQCCTNAPSVADNPPPPAGYALMAQSAVTSDMTTWAVAILDDPTTYPMFSTTTKTFGTQLVLARVEWHPPDFNNSVVHRGVTLYVPT